MIHKKITNNNFNNDYLFNYFKLASIFEFKLFKNFSIFAGPTLNYYLGFKNNNMEVVDFISTTYNIPLFEKTEKYMFHKSWIGFQIGFSII